MNYLRKFKVLFLLAVGATWFSAPAKAFDVMDNQGFGTPMVAYTIQVPQNWTAKGEIIWNKPCSGNDYYELVLTVRSPDGLRGLRIMPGHQIVWSEMNVSGFDPATAQMMIAQNEADRNRMRTQFRNSNCHVGQMTGTDQLLTELMLPDRPQGAQVVKKVPNDPVLKSFQTTFGPDQPGLGTFYDATVATLNYRLGSQAIEETLSLSW